MSGIAPYFYNSPIPNGKSPNVLFSDVLQGTLNVPILTFTDGIFKILANNGSTDYIFPKRFTDPSMRLDKFAYAAGTAGVYTMNLSGVTPVVGKVYRWQIIGGSAINPINVSGLAIATTTSANDLAATVNTSMTNANGAALFTNTVSNSTITVSEASAATGGFTLFFPNDTNATFGTTTSNVPAFGTVAQVALYKPTVTSGTFNLYQWSFNNDDINILGTGVSGFTNLFVQLWLDTGATNYAAADALIMSFADGGSYWGASYSQVQMQAAFNLPK